MFFREICVKTFLELRKNHQKIVLLLEMISHGNEHLPCFSGIYVCIFINMCIFSGEYL
jgi:phosphatidylinositol kinase/protein kinase (PI-3  family)